MGDFISYVSGLTGSVMTCDFPVGLSVAVNELVVDAILQVKISPNDSTDHFEKIQKIFVDVLSDCPDLVSYTLESPYLPAFIANLHSHFEVFSTKTMSGDGGDADTYWSRVQQLQSGLAVAANLVVCLVRERHLETDHLNLEKSGIYNLMALFFRLDLMQIPRREMRKITEVFNLLIMNDYTKAAAHSALSGVSSVRKSLEQAYGRPIHKVASDEPKRLLQARGETPKLTAKRRRPDIATVFLPWEASESQAVSYWNAFSALQTDIKGEYKGESYFTRLEKAKSLLELSLSHYQALSAAENKDIRIVQKYLNEVVVKLGEVSSARTPG